MNFLKIITVISHGQVCRIFAKTEYLEILDYAIEFRNSTKVLQSRAMNEF